MKNDTQSTFLETTKIVLALLGLIAIVTGFGWCEWRGYKDRFPSGGFLGFVTSCNGNRK
jgi:hypothetical protein